MFLAWMSRWKEPGLLRGDLLADYWQSVTPWFYRAAFWTASAVGLEPLVLVKLLPALLCLVASLFSYRFLRAIGAEPFAAFVTTAVLLMHLAEAGVIANGTPRSFWPPLMLAALDGLARKKALQTAGSQLLLTGCYPPMALVLAPVIGATVFSWHAPYCLDFSRQRVVLVAASALATLVGLLPFLILSGQFSPAVTLAEALHIPTFGPGGRNQITAPDGSIDLLCGRRLGLFRRCHGTFGFLLMFGSVLGGTAILAWRTLRPAEGRAQSALPFSFLLASLAWFALASLVLFRMYLPNRYTAALLTLGILCLVPMAVEFGKAALRRKGLSPAVAAVIVSLAAISGVAAVRPRPILTAPLDHEFVAAIGALPRDAVVAGFVSDLDFSPVLTNRSTLFSAELTVGFHHGYLRQVLARMADMRDVTLTHEPAVLINRLGRNEVSIFAVYPEMLAEARLPRPFRGFFGPDLIDAEAAAARHGETLLGRLAPECIVQKFTTVLMLDAVCLAGAAKRLQ